MFMYLKHLFFAFGHSKAYTLGSCKRLYMFVVQDKIYFIPPNDSFDSDEESLDADEESLDADEESLESDSALLFLRSEIKKRNK